MIETVLTIAIVVGFSGYTVGFLVGLLVARERWKNAAKSD